jgi:hypothetical protein
LDEKQHRLQARGTITFVNRSHVALSELWFHLYLNAFENKNTLYLRGPGGRNGGLTGAPGWVRVKSLRSARYANRDLWQGAAPHSPGDPRDRTDIRVPLPDPLGSGETLVLECEFESQLPEIVERTGFAQHFAFHPFAEFYADFGDYEIELDVPANYALGSSGTLSRLAPASGSNGRATYRARAQGVHDFAWMAAPDFDLDERQLGPTQLRVLTPQGAHSASARILETVRIDLAYFQGAFGPYPYETLTVVHPPPYAERAGGMEYPTFFTVGGPNWLAPLGIRWVESVTAHELGHQWFYGLVATNEARWPFLDEGLNSHADWRALEHQLGTGSQFEFGRLRVSRAAIGRYSGLRAGAEEIVTQPASEFSSFQALAGQIYGRTALGLETLRRVYGAAAFDRTLRDYAEEQRYRHPTPTDFFAAIERGLGAQAREALETVLARRGSVDQRLGSITPRTLAAGAGFRYRVQVRRRGTVVLPFELRADFEDGTHQTQRISEPRALETLEFTHRARLRRVVLDPENKQLLDENLLDNRAYAGHHDDAAHSEFELRWLAQLALRGLSP